MHVIGAAQHKKNSWTGYTFDPSLYPDPAAWLASMHDQGLLLAANLHDDVGIGTVGGEARCRRQDYGRNQRLRHDPVHDVRQQDVRVRGGGRRAARSGIRIGGDLPDGGFDAWWIDWQQGGDHGGCAGGAQNPTIWTNRLRSTDAKRRAVMARGAGCPWRQSPRRRRGGPVGRNMVLARWAGWGRTATKWASRAT